MYIVNITPEIDLDHGFRLESNNIFLFDKKENAETFMELTIMTNITKNHTMFYHEAVEEWGSSIEEFNKWIESSIKCGKWYGLCGYSIQLTEIQKRD
jgi:hypothetical protein